MAVRLPAGPICKLDSTSHCMQLFSQLSCLCTDYTQDATAPHQEALLPPAPPLSSCLVPCPRSKQGLSFPEFLPQDVCTSSPEFVLVPIRPPLSPAQRGCPWSPPLAQPFSPVLTVRACPESELGSWRRICPWRVQGRVESLGELCLCWGYTDSL